MTEDELLTVFGTGYSTYEGLAAVAAAAWDEAEDAAARAASESSSEGVTPEGFRQMFDMFTPNPYQPTPEEQQKEEPN